MTSLLLRMLLETSASRLSDRPQIPALPVLVPIAVSVFIVVLARMRVRGSLSWPRVVLVAAWCVYAVGLLRSVLFPYPLLLGGNRPPVPWTDDIQSVPLATVPDDPSGMALNVLLFIPFGFLTALTLDRATFRRVVFLGFLVSLGIEVAQLVGDLTVSVGRVADTDDLIGNTLGAALGYLTFCLARRLARVRPLND